MNYKRIYDSLITRAKSRITIGYVERHHIIPKCLGGTDDDFNLVALYPEEHFLAHILLVKIYPYEKKLILAVHKMCQPIKNGRPKRKLFGWLRRLHAKRISEINSGEGNSQYGTRWAWVNKNGKVKKIPLHNLEECMAEGWARGTKPKFASSKTKAPMNLDQLREYYLIYNSMGWDTFVEKTGYKYSKQNLVTIFSRYLPEFVPQNGKKRG